MEEKFMLAEEFKTVVANGKIQIPDSIKEGSLLPETYFYSYNDTKSGIIKRMQEAMNKSINEMWELRDHSIPIKTKEQQKQFFVPPKFPLRLEKLVYFL
jgi:cell division protein YceG involved in septum cleavage